MFPSRLVMQENKNEMPREDEQSCSKQGNEGSHVVKGTAYRTNMAAVSCPEPHGASLPAS